MTKNTKLLLAAGAVVGAGWLVINFRNRARYMRSIGYTGDFIGLAFHNLFGIIEYHPEQLKRGT